MIISYNTVDAMRSPAGHYINYYATCLKQIRGVVS